MPNVRRHTHTHVFVLTPFLILGYSEPIYSQPMKKPVPTDHPIIDDIKHELQELRQLDVQQRKNRQTSRNVKTISKLQGINNMSGFKMSYFKSTIQGSLREWRLKCRQHLDQVHQEKITSLMEQLSQRERELSIQTNVNIKLNTDNTKLKEKVLELAMTQNFTASQGSG